MADLYGLTKIDRGRVERTVREVERSTNVGNRRARPMPPGVNGMAHRVKIQSVQAVTNGIISVKLLDSDDVESGEAFDVYCFPDKSATDIDNYLPKLQTSGLYDTVNITKIGSVWFLAYPTLIEAGTNAVTVSATAETIFGRIMAAIGTW